MIGHQEKYLALVDGAEGLSTFFAELGLLVAAELVLLAILAMFVVVFLIVLFAVIVATLTLRWCARLFRPARARREARSATPPSRADHTITPRR